AAKIDNRFGLKIGVIDSSQAINVRIELAGDPIESHIVRLENGANLIIFLLSDRIEHVIVTASAAECYPEKSLGSVFHRFFEPAFPTEQFEIPHQESSGAKGVGVLRAKFIRRQHFQD